jgi:hypothetical protein
MAFDYQSGHEPYPYATMTISDIQFSADPGP